ncbi:MAG: hypothetical protein ACLT5P_02800 [Flavonifractor plautii]
MLKITCEGVYYKNGGFVPAKDGPAAGLPALEKAREGTMAHAILKAHNTGDNMEELAIRFDAMASHDITYVGIIQTARASGMQAFCPTCSPTATTPVPWGHHQRGRPCGPACRRRRSTAASLSPPTRASFTPICGSGTPPPAGPGSDPTPATALRHHGHRRGGPELARQLLSKLITSVPKVIAIPHRHAHPRSPDVRGVRSTFKDGVVKNAVMEFFGPGVANLSMDYRSGIDDDHRDHLPVLHLACRSTLRPPGRTGPGRGVQAPGPRRRGLL